MTAGNSQYRQIRAARRDCVRARAAALFISRWRWQCFAVTASAPQVWHAPRAEASRATRRTRARRVGRDPGGSGGNAGASGSSASRTIGSRAPRPPRPGGPHDSVRTCAQSISPRPSAISLASDQGGHRTTPRYRAKSGSIIVSPLDRARGSGPMADQPTRGDQQPENGQRRRLPTASSQPLPAGVP